MDEAQIQLMIQNVVAAALKAQSAILDKRRKASIEWYFTRQRQTEIIFIRNTVKHKET